MDSHADAFLILGGDINACMNENDYLNRTSSTKEIALVDYIKANNETCKIIDAYRSKISNGGYTYKHLPLD